MADLKRWFKVWTAILDDPHHVDLSLEDVGRWTRLGAMTALSGKGGRLVVTPPAKRLLQVLETDTIAAAKLVIKRLPNVHVEEGENVNGEFTVTWRNWTKYQADSTIAARVKRLRRKRRGEERRGEEKRREETLTTITLPPLRAEEPAEGSIWGKPEDLVALYNAEAPDNVAAVEVLSPKRRDKARKALRQYPGEPWWKEVFAQYRRSRFLRGLTKPTEGHASFRPDFDWLLSSGKSGVENYVRVHDGMYAD